MAEKASLNLVPSWVCGCNQALDYPEHGNTAQLGGSHYVEDSPWIHMVRFEIRVISNRISAACSPNEPIRTQYSTR